ncbi:hypothetical protein [Hyperthermus butylicus]|uniref:Uncharacterized protein n=1 Tax=Hyperthermus butylicus (strain DSM 5456 / JCM 9403 / PLM1-5) TaxID=415426 RepID=A2BMJ2_HYPBU|nr:hypothetical protein [Hyperthermus butylicus]ABM81203.1 hypothetical protein Hbut_1378 [Hyperthermus butylicus DSM 5456]
MPATVKYHGHLFVVGPGLDEVLEPGKRLVLLDEFYADLYGEYFFLGYDVLAETINLSRGDTIGAYTAAVLLDGDPAVVVCGQNPWNCVVGLAAYMVLWGNTEPLDAVKQAWNTLAKLYPGREELVVPRQALAALHGLKAALEAAGSRDRLGPLIALASNYEYGRGRLHYGESIAWAAGLGATPLQVLTVLLHFLAEGPGGPPATILRQRLEAVGEANLLSLLGPDAEEALAALRAYCRGDMDDSAAALLALIESLRPGEPGVNHVGREGDKLLVYCSSGGEGEPVRECVEAVGQADKLLSKTGLGLSGVKVVPGEPEPLRL